MKSIILLIALFFVAGPLMAQSSKNPDQAAEQAVEDAILQLFAGMKAGDSAMVHNVCHGHTRLATSYVDREGKPGTEEITLEEFLLAVGNPHTEVWNEVPKSIEVRVDDNMATAWVPYSFYVDDRFSHCGVNAFQLVKDSSGWKILNITDTRRVSGCKEKQ
jgi:hypothetical protein